MNGAVSSDGTRIATYEEPAQGKPEFVFIHGWAQQSMCWGPVMDRLKGRAHMVAMDLRGHGASDVPEGEAPYIDTKLWGDDVKAVIEAHGLTRPVLVGWSYGSRVIASYIATHGNDALAGIVLAGGIIALGKAREPWMTGEASPGMNRDLYTNDLTRRLTATADFVAACTAKPLDVRTYAELVGVNMMVPPHVRRALFNADLDLRPIYAAMSCPGLVIHGAQDDVVAPVVGKGLAEVMQQSNYLSYAGVGHAPFLEEPERFAADILDFALMQTGEMTT